MNAPKKPYTRPAVTELDASDPKARALFAQAHGLVLCCGVAWSLKASTDWHVGVSKECGASFDGKCGVCQKPLAGRPS